MAETVRDTIKRITKAHLELGNELFGQCLTAVGWVNDTIPSDAPNIVELSMADVMAGGVVVGSSLVGKRPIFVVRYQGFQWFNAPMIVNYAGKSKEMWGIACPIFIRSIAMEGGIGPVAGSSHHGIYLRTPGIKIASPMTPMEYQSIYDIFMKGDDPIYVSEHRKSYSNDQELQNIVHENPDFVLFPFSVTRFEAEKASLELAHEGIKVSVFHQLWIHPLKPLEKELENLEKSKFGGLILDDDYPNGIAKQIAYEFMIRTSKPVFVLCLKEKVAGFHPLHDNLPPTASEIVTFIKNRIEREAGNFHRNACYQGA